MASSSLVEIDALEVFVLVDNELDPISTYQIPGLKVVGQMPVIAAQAPLDGSARGGATHELRLKNLCCAAHGLSLMIV